MRKVIDFVNSILKNDMINKKFTKIYSNNTWRGKTSVSGPGSELEQTKHIIPALEKLTKQEKIKSILDIPCGDFNWMKEVNLEQVVYTGGDIVDPLVQINKLKFTNASRNFMTLNLIEDELPKGDVIFVRDCLVHFSNDDIFKAVNNILRGDFKYLITTTFPDRESNRDIATGEWRPLNLEVSPFFFPKPKSIIVEHCTEGDGIYKDKSLGVWEVEELKFAMKKLKL